MTFYLGLVYLKIFSTAKQVTSFVWVSGESLDLKAPLQHAITSDNFPSHLAIWQHEQETCA